VTAKSKQKRTQAHRLQEAAASSKVPKESSGTDGTAMDKVESLPARAPLEEQGGIVKPILLEKQPEEMEFAYFHQETPVLPESQKMADELEVRSLENADLQYVVQSFIKLQKERPNHYRLGYLRKLLLQSIDQFKRKKVLDKVQGECAFFFIILSCFPLGILSVLFFFSFFFFF